MDWYPSGAKWAALDWLDWNRIGTELTSDWQSIGMILTMDWYKIGDGLAQDLHQIDNGYTSDWQWIDIGLATCWHCRIAMDRIGRWIGASAVSCDLMACRDTSAGPL